MRRTRQRQAVRSAFERAERPLSPAECLELAADDVPSLGIATVYRHIKQLADDGWLDVVALPGAANRYEVAGQRHHHHFHCSDCDGVFDVDSCPREISRMVPSGFELESHEIILYGRCRECSDGSPTGN